MLTLTLDRAARLLPGDVDDAHRSAHGGFYNTDAAHGRHYMGEETTDYFEDHRRSAMKASRAKGEFAEPNMERVSPDDDADDADDGFRVYEDRAEGHDEL